MWQKNKQTLTEAAEIQMSWTLFRKLSFHWLSFPWQTGRLVSTATEGFSLWTTWTEPPPGSVPPGPRPHRVWLAPTPFSRWSSWTAGERWSIITGRNTSKSPNRPQWWLLTGQWSKSKLCPVSPAFNGTFALELLNPRNLEQNKTWKVSSGEARTASVLSWLDF